MLAGFLYAQLEAREHIQEHRAIIWEFYYSHLKSWAENNGVKLPTVPDICEQPYHMFYMILPSYEERQAFINYLKSKGIHSVFHYLPLHLSPLGIQVSEKKADCPVTEHISDRIVRLPFYNELTKRELETIVEAICNFRKIKQLKIRLRKEV